MRRIAFIAGLLFMPFGACFAETIPAFDAVITVESDATIAVTERILYDFGGEERHGIFRNIPYSYQAGTETYTADVSLVTVTDEAGEPYPFNESRGRGMLTLKIGDPDVTITGQHLYVISYTVHGPFLYFEDADELYWNVTGAWERSIAEASVLINLPVGARVTDAACYQGSQGDTSPCDEDEKLVNAERAGYHAVARELAAGEGLTVAVSFPKGTIAVVEKPWTPDTQTPWYAYLALCIPVGALVFIVRLWYTRGRDPRGRTTIVPEYEPPTGLSPALAGIVYNERIEPREISAEIVYLAVAGFIRIHRIERKALIFTVTDYLFERVGSNEPNDEVGKLILFKLFQAEFAGEADVDGAQVHGTLLSKMQHKFVQERDAITDALYGEVLDRGYFVERPDKVRTRYIASGIGLAVVSSFLFGAGTTVTATLAASLIASGALIAIGGWFMPARTADGVRIKEQLEGFKRYLDVAEKDRLAFHNAPEKTPKLFDTYLPYAMAFGVEKAWAKQFEGMYTEQPGWYTSPTGTFSAALFASDLGTFSSDFTAASAPQSSGAGGGGSSGGGFGGGGGGSW